ncbi:PAS domain-containing sensor histidine kinase [Tuberibacillus sp. Marseille-P3662]|uniref:PAS domain-containing sensor histidine kinase n=1 Tax=Tuberibacillus sp. Marseille-P3662 TaxID=1965358 RepID=UPI000A1C931E|nr:PAS domain-containing sensor histidine kinase [Tuberibacillus sp. Marseille-P3662]
MFRPSNSQDNNDIKNFVAFTNCFSDMISRISIADSSIIYVSPSCKRLLGFTSQELLNHSLFDFVHPNDRLKVEQAFAVKTHDTDKVVYRMKRQEGDYIWVETTFCHYEYLESQDHEQYFCLTRDVTDLKLTEEQLKENQKKYRDLVEHSHDTIGVVTFDGCWIFINGSGKKLFGITRIGEMIGRSMFEFVKKQDHEKLETAINETIKQQSIQELRDITISRSDHEMRQTEIKMIPTSYKGRETIQVVLRDISDRKKTEEMLQQTEKLSVVGELAAGIAHEIRNPLTAVKGFAQLLKQHNYADVMLQELDRIEEIVNDLLILAKPQVTSTEVTDLIKIMNKTVTLMNPQAIMHNVTIQTQFSSEEIKVECEADQLKQVFINVIKNAIEAMENGGNINIYIDDYHHYVMLRFIDTGTGITPDRLKKLGEPFYSTKEKGTGLGLMTSKKIIENHHGQFNIDSKVNKGTTVTMTLPKSLATN